MEEFLTPQPFIVRDWDTNTSREHHPQEASTGYVFSLTDPNVGAGISSGANAARNSASAKGKALKSKIESRTWVAGQQSTLSAFSLIGPNAPNGNSSRERAKARQNKDGKKINEGL